MRRRRKADTLVDAVTLEMEDGARLRASVTSLGGERPYWAILDAKGTQYIGPAADAKRTPESVERLIRDWWASRNSVDDATTRATEPRRH